jgi:hypothetical protein
MKMKTLKKLLFAMLTLSMFATCSEDNLPNDETMQFTGIKWKLTSFVINGEARTPEHDSDDRYWLLFKEDNTLEGKSSMNELSGTYEMDMRASSFRITNLGGTKIGEVGDGQFFVESLQAVRSFKLREGVLKLYYNATDYLLFRFDSEFVNPYRETIVGKWQLRLASYRYADERGRLDMFSFDENPVYYEFMENNKLIVTGSERALPDLIFVSEGEHDYMYQRPNVGILALPGRNFSIDQSKPIFCLPLADSDEMPLDGATLEPETGRTLEWKKVLYRQRGGVK